MHADYILRYRNIKIMNKEHQFKIVVAILWIAVAAAVPVFAIQVYEVIITLNKKYPDLGFSNWLVIIVWIFSVFLTIKITKGLCKKIHWSKACNIEGMAAGMLYIFVSALIFIYATA